MLPPGRTRMRAVSALLAAAASLLALSVCPLETIEASLSTNVSSAYPSSWW